MHFATIISLALLSQLPATFARPRTITKVEVVTLAPGQSPPAASPAPVPVQGKYAANNFERPHNRHTHKKVIQVVRPVEQPQEQEKPQVESFVPDTTVQKQKVDTNPAPIVQEAKKEDPPKVETTPQDTTTNTQTTNTETQDTSTTSGGGSAPGDMQAVLDKHNSLRKSRNADPLTWDASVASHAQSVDTTIGGCPMGMIHEDGGPNGENLAGGSPSINLEGAVQGWFNEGPPAQGGYNHYSQVVWKGTTKLGCYLGCDGQRLRCQYSPAGNMMGAFADNVE